MTNERRSSSPFDLVALGDRALNHNRDQIPDIEPQLRRLNMVWVRGTARDLVTTPTSAALLGGAALSLLRGRFMAASLFAAALLVQQAVTKQIKRGTINNTRGPKDTEREDLEIERYALKVQRGDYGKLEVIAFK